MKQILKLIAAIIIMVITMDAHAAKNNDVTLIVTSDGTTKDEAIKNALRSAIEQTYGVFVSANTDILNDEMISDEIATVASGNIKSYKVLSESQSNAGTTVTLEAVVSVGKLISYAKSKGAEVEFDGASMFADLELQELYRKNEESAIENALCELTELFNNGYDYELKIEKNRDNYRMGYPNDDSSDIIFFNCEIKAKLNSIGESAWKELCDLLKVLGKNLDEGYPVAIFTGSAQYNGSTHPMDYYFLRSKSGAMSMMQFINNLPNLIKNISVIVGDEKYNISKELMDYADVYRLDPEFVRDRTTMPYRKKKGNNSGKYVYLLQIPKGNLKHIRNIKIEHN